MSYDLAVFDPRPELRLRAAFESWYDERTEWEDDLDYNQPSNATPALQAWFDEIRQKFVPMNGPLAPDDVGTREDELVADYTICKDLIYIAFSWGDAEAAYEMAKQLAAKHKVGFLDASGDEGAAWFPCAGDSLEVIHVAAENSDE